MTCYHQLYSSLKLLFSLACNSFELSTVSESFSLKNACFFVAINFSALYLAFLYIYLWICSLAFLNALNSMSLDLRFSSNSPLNQFWVLPLSLSGIPKGDILSGIPKGDILSKSLTLLILRGATLWMTLSLPTLSLSVCELFQGPAPSSVYSNFVKQIHKKLKVMKSYVKINELWESHLSLSVSISTMKIISN